VDLRWEFDGTTLAVIPDTPFLRTYRIDYVNMSRDATLSMAVTPQVSNATGGIASTSGGGNASVTRIEDITRNRFWETLEKNIRDILQESDKILPSGSSETLTEHLDQQITTGTGTTPAPHARSKASAPPGIAASPNPASLNQQGSTLVRRSTYREAATVIMNPESGVITVRATERQHERTEEFLNHVMSSVRRQVLIEATIVEVQLAHNYQQGIDWQRMRGDGSGLTLTQANPGLLAGSSGGSALANITQVPSGKLTAQSTAVDNNTGSLFVLGWKNSGAFGNFAAAVKLLESFGNVKVLSSPKLAVLNNQTAMLNVGSQVVYFKVNANTTTSSAGLAQTTVDTTPQTASVGLLLSVTPQISANGTVILNVRPSVSRVTRFRQDPNPQIPASIQNLVPEIERREMESVLRIADGDIAVLGGLMQDAIDQKDDEVPGLASLPLIGRLFAYRNHSSNKTELVIFLRPTILHEGQPQVAAAGLNDLLPSTNFFGGITPRNAVHQYKESP
jgi:general secretion pathway protein D